MSLLKLISINFGWFDNFLKQFSDVDYITSKHIRKNFPNKLILNEERDGFFCCALCGTSLRTKQDFFLFEDGEKKLFLYNRFITTPLLLNAIKSKLRSLPDDIDIGPDLSKVSDLKVLKARNGRLVLYRGKIPTKRVLKIVPLALFLINASKKSRQVGKSNNRHPVLGFISDKTEHINEKDRSHSCWNKLFFFFCFSSH